jgi:tricorn protease
MTVTIDPREEWQQLFVEAWRLQRDYFYVDNMHGVDWPAVRAHYEKMLDDCVTREDLSYVIREMISELNIGHAYYFGGDVEDQPQETVGMLGVNWTLADGAYRIEGICEGAPWDVDARNPLREPGVDVKEGDYLLAVNGIPVDTGKDPWAPFVGLAGRTITITVSEKPQIGEDARDVVVKPLSNEAGLRYREWIEKNRARVEANSGGRVGYVYVPDTSIGGQNDLVRQYFSQIEKQALIIDERWNGGGQVPSRFIEMLNRPVTNYWARRDANDFKWPPDAHHGPKCMLINGLAGSGGDLFPWYFRDAGLGPLIGTRTWGGLVGISGNPQLIDGGVVTVPTFGFYERDGTWGVEGHGVDPDIEVIDDPALMCNGDDPQLDAAIGLMLEEIEQFPYVPPERPAAPDRSGMGIRPEDH